MRIYLIKIFHKIILFCIVCILIYKIKMSLNEFKSNKKTSMNIDDRCSPINHNKPYQVVIDGDIYPKRDLLALNKSLNFLCLNKNKILKKILLWNKFAGDNTFMVGLTGPIEPFKRHQCPVTNCELINDRKRVNESDYVIVHIGENPIERFPIYRPVNQQWIFFLHESPVHVHDNYTYLDNIFNLTYTYKLNSDFISYYYLFANMEWAYNDNFNLKYNYMEDKTEFAAALISNCNDKSNRIAYINELKKYVSVKIYGNCGEKCQKVKNCRESIAKRNMFYLSFENSENYITEKLFTILKYQIVPIVLGAGPYDYYIPKSAYINVKNFESPKKLADYLIFLSKNATAYNAYFKWKKHVKFFEPNRPKFSFICDLCIKLQLNSFFGTEKKILTNVNKFWNQEKECVVKLF